MSFIAYCLSDTGRVRNINEDSVTIAPPPSEEVAARLGHLFVLADGMGGALAGEVASAHAIETIPPAYYSSEGSPSEALVAAIQHANGTLYERAQHEGRIGMGTTTVAAAILDGKLYVAHVGDSRLYVIREGRIAALTRDHSLVAEQVAAGIITTEEAARHPHRNVISRAVGTAPHVDVELSPNSPLTLHDGDVILICSDGLTEYVKPNRLIELISGRTPEEAAPLLIKAANDGGGSDNISVLIIRYGDAPASEGVTAQQAAVGAAAAEITQAVPVADSERPAPPPPPPRTPATPPPEPERHRPSLVVPAILLLLLLVAGLYALWWLFGDNFTASVITPTPTLAGILEEVPTPTLTPEGALAATATVGRSPTATPTATMRPRPTRTVTATRSATGTRAATATRRPSPTVTRTPRPTLTPRPTRTPTPQSNIVPLPSIRLLEPKDGATVLTQPLTFRATVTNVQAGDDVQLRLLDGEQILYRAPMRQDGGNQYSATVARPPFVAPPTIGWLVVVIEPARGKSGQTVYSPSQPYLLTWQPARTTVTP